MCGVRYTSILQKNCIIRCYNIAFQEYQIFFLESTFHLNKRWGGGGGGGGGGEEDGRSESKLN